MQNLRREASARSVDPSRLIFAAWQFERDHLARCALADLFLDTYPYGAHTTASDSLWSQVPLITRPGATFASRVATSLLRAVGLDRLSVSSREEYRVLAIRLAHVPAELEALKRVLATARAGSTLFDSAAYCRKFEAVFQEMVAACGRGEAPGPIEPQDARR